MQMSHAPTAADVPVIAAAAAEELQARFVRRYADGFLEHHLSQVSQNGGPLSSELALIVRLAPPKLPTRFCAPKP
jgi:hypothetical protein